MKKIMTNFFVMIHHYCKSMLIIYFASFNLYAVEVDAKYWQKIGPEGAYVRHFITNQQQTEVIYVSYSDYVNSTTTRYLKSINGGIVGLLFLKYPVQCQVTRIKFPITYRTA